MQLPKTGDPIKFAKKNARLQAHCTLSDFARLQEICDQGDHQADITLQFGQDASRFYFIQGTIKATVNLICQRCNALMTHELDISFLLSPVVSEERAKKLPDQYEPVFMQDESIAVYDMIEDELLLALPMVPKHEVCG